MKTKLLFQRLALVVLLAVVGCLQGFAQTYYSKVTLKLNGNNDIYNLGTTMIGGKVYVGTTAEEAESCTYEYSSERVQALEGASHVYYLYAKADEGFEVAGFGTTAAATTSFNNQGANPYKVTVTATSTDEAAPTEKIYYASFKYAANNKPNVCYANFTLVAMLAQDDGTGKLVNVESAEAGMLGLNYNPDASGKGAVTTEPTWHSGSSYASEAISKPYTSGTVYFPYTIFAKPNPGYEFVGWASTSTSTNPSQKGTKVDDYSYYYADLYTRTSVSNVNYPGSGGIEGGPKTKKYYAVFKKLEQMEEPTGTTSVEVTEVKGTTELVEGSVNKNFSVDLVLNEDLPYDKPGSDKNAKPAEILKQFVTVTGANGNKSEVASYSLTYEATDLGEGGTSGTGSFGTLYSCHTIRLFFPYGIKADTYTVHLPYGLYTTVNGNKTPTYEFTINVTADENPYLTIKSQLPTEGMTIKYVKATQTKEPDNSKGEFDSSKITAAIEFNEVVESIDESKKDGVTLVNTTEGVNYKPLSVLRDAAIFGKVSGAVSIAFPELVNGEYTLTIPEGLFVGAAKTNEKITVHFTVSGFSATLKPYEMVTDHISPKSGDMTQSIEKLSDITISYKEPVVALIGDDSKITVKGYTEEIVGEGEGANAVRTYYDVFTIPSTKIEDGKLIVSFSPALRTGLYEVNIPAGMAANMEPGTMTMAERVNAGYAETPAHNNLTFKVVSPDPWVGEHEVQFATYNYMTRTQGDPQTTFYTIVKEGDNYYLTDLLDSSDEPNKVLLDVVDATTLTIHEGGFSNDDVTYNIAPMSMVGGSNDPIYFVLGDDDKVTVPNKGLIYIEDEAYNMYMFVFGSNLETEEPELNTVDFVSSTPADGALVAPLKKITLAYKKPFAGFDPEKDPKAACSLKDSEGKEITITAVNHYNTDDAAHEIDFKVAENLAPGTYTFTFDAGVMQGGNVMTGIYTNAAAEITFTVGTVEEANMVVTAAKYGTFVAPFDVTEIPEGVTASKVTGSANGVLVLEAVETIPAHTPVVLQSETPVSEKTLSGIAAPYAKEEAVTEGLLNGVYVPTQAPVGSYVLQNHSGKIGFFVVGSTIPVVAKNRCYLIDSTAASAHAFYFTEDDATAINGINAEIINAEGIYNVNGVRMNSLQKGLNIIKTANGTKKVMIK